MDYLFFTYLTGSILSVLLFHKGLNEALREDLVEDDELVNNIAYIVSFLGSWFFVIYLLSGGINNE